MKWVVEMKQVATNVIGIHGRAGVGKDTLADMLVDSHGYTKYSFAAPLKEIGEELFRWTPAWLEHVGKETVVETSVVASEQVLECICRHVQNFVSVTRFLSRMMDVLKPHQIHGKEGWWIDGGSYAWRISPRRFYQLVGTEVGRFLDNDLWVKKAEDVLIMHPENQYVLADVRMENEAAMVRRQGLLVMLYRDASTDLGANVGHSSESGVLMKEGDLVVLNNGTKGELYGKVRSIVEEIEGGRRVQKGGSTLG